MDARGQALVATGGGPFPDVLRAQREHRLVSSIVSAGGESEARVALPLDGAGRGSALALRKSLSDLTGAQRVVRRALPVAAAIALTAALLVAFLVAGRPRPAGALRAGRVRAAHGSRRTSARP